jgi:hypothetical protein
MAGAKIYLSGVAGELADDGNGAAKVNLPNTAEQSGFAVSVSEVDDGTARGFRTMRSGEVTADFRARVGMDTPMLDVSFEGTIPHGNVLQQAVSGMTGAQAGGFFVLNSGNATAATNRAQVVSYRTVPLFGSFPTYLEIWMREGNPSATNAISEWGFGYPNAGVAVPTDGVFIRRNGSGVLQAVLNFGGVETPATLTMTNVHSRDGVGLYDPAEVNHWVIAANNDSVEFWCNDVLVADVSTPAGQGAPMSSSAQPFFARTYVPTGLTASAGRRIELCYIGSALGDANINQSFWMTMAAMGRGSYQTQAGVAPAQTSNSVNSTIPATGTLSNTGASYTTFGGQWRIAATAGAETDYALFGFQVPQGTANLAGRTLHITGVRIGETWVEGAAIATTPTVFQWGIATGSTAVSLATADAVGTVSPKRKLLGSQSFLVGEAIGALKDGFDNDIGMAAFPGTFVHVVLKMPVGTATALQFFRGTVAIDGYYL